MALDDISLSFIGTVKQRRIAIPNNSLITLIEGDIDKRIWVWRFEISSAVAAKFTIFSGTNPIFEMHSGRKWGHVDPSESRSPRYITNSGEDFIIQASVASLDAKVYLQWQVKGGIEGE